MTCSLATRYRVLRLPVYPFAFSRISRRFFFAWTDRFTLAIGSCPQQTFDLLALGGDLGHALDTPASAGALLREHVIARRLAVEQLAVPRDAEPFRRRTVGLHLRHVRHPSS